MSSPPGHTPPNLEVFQSTIMASGIQDGSDLVDRSILQNKQEGGSMIGPGYVDGETGEW